MIPFRPCFGSDTPQTLAPYSSRLIVIADDEDSKMPIATAVKRCLATGA